MSWMSLLMYSRLCKSSVRVMFSERSSPLVPANVTVQGRLRSLRQLTTRVLSGSVLRWALMSVTMSPRPCLFLKQLLTRPL